MIHIHNDEVTNLLSPQNMLITCDKLQCVFIWTLQ